ncbi:MAG: cache domain-containing protein, partial [Clostridia bacterium]|nr:cache domain-containing protein [Clostridia bacterium]
MKLKNKTLLMILVPVFLIFVTIISVVSFKVYQKEKETAGLLAESISKEYASKIEAELEVPLDVARSMADVQEGLLERGYEDRSSTNAFLKNILEDNENFFGAWVCFEPNAFDGKDTQYAGTSGYDSTGRFVPYWYREGNDAKLDYLKDYDVSDYYLLALQTGKESVTEPYEYETGGKIVLMTSFAVPIKYNGKIIGVAGIDVSLDGLQEIGNSAKLFQTGFGKLISNKGLLVTHPDINKTGQPVGEVKSGETKKIVEEIGKNGVYSQCGYSEELAKDAFEAFAPITIGNTGTPWYFGTVVPQEEVFGDVYKLIKSMILLSLLGLLIIGGIIYVIAGNIVKPITAVTERLGELANYDFTYKETAKAIKYMDRKDEIGQITKALR